MKPLFLLAVIVISLGYVDPPSSFAQPAKSWEIRLVDVPLTNLNLRATGSDGSIIATSYTQNAPQRVFWVSSDGQRVDDLTQSWDYYTDVVYVSSDQILARSREEYAYGINGSLAVPGRLSHFSRINGIVAKNVYDLPGTAIFTEYQFSNQTYTGPLAFFTFTVVNGATYLTKWKFQGLETPSTVNLNLRKTLSNGLTLNADSGPSAQGSIDVSEDLKNWRLLTNFTGQVELPVDQRRKGEEFFRSR